MSDTGSFNVVALAGGVGGAKLVDGLYQIILPDCLTIIVNTGDDFEHFGLRICPDLDTVCYTLAGIANPETGWGRKDDSWVVLDNLAQLGGPVWFHLGDRDLATHLERTRLLHLGYTLTQITQRFCHAWNIKAKVLPMSDDSVATQVITDEGVLPFQEYFVLHQCQPRVRGFRLEGIEHARPTDAVMRALECAHMIIFCPSNPWVSIDPILALPGIKEHLRSPNKDNGENPHRMVIGVSPIIGGKAVKGPAAKMFTELGMDASVLSIAEHYGSRKEGGLLDGLVIDYVDADLKGEIEDLGIRTMVTNILMKDREDRVRLAREVMAFAESLIAEKLSLGMVGNKDQP